MFMAESGCTCPYAGTFGHSSTTCPALVEARELMELTNEERDRALNGYRAAVRHNYGDSLS